MRSSLKAIGFFVIDSQVGNIRGNNFQKGDRANYEGGGGCQLLKYE